MSKIIYQSLLKYSKLSSEDKMQPKRLFFLFVILGLIMIFISPSQSYAIHSIRETTGCYPVPDGLVYWIQAENNANDWTGNHHGTIYGAMSFSTGMVGNAFVFDGEDDSVVIPPDSDIPHGSDPRTIEMWVHSETGSWVTDTHPVFHTGSMSTHAAFGIDFDDYPKLQFYTWADDLIISTALPEVGWFHVAMVYDGSTLLSAYINGALSDSRVLSDLLNTDSLETYIGSGIDSNGYPQFYLGNIDEVSMYDRALSDTEILGIYNAGSYGKCSNQKPIANAGSDQSVDTLTLVTLDGSLSNDPDNNLPLTYQWTQIGGPTVTLNSSTISNPAFIAPIDPASLVFSLIVTDSLGMESDSDEAIVIVNNQAPVADAGPNQFVEILSLVTLDGCLSSDPDEDTSLIFLWTQTSGENVTLSNPGTCNPTFKAPENPGEITFSLVVTDSRGLDSNPDYVQISVYDYKLFLPMIY